VHHPLIHSGFAPIPLEKPGPTLPPPLLLAGLHPSPSPLTVVDSPIPAQCRGSVPSHSAPQRNRCPACPSLQPLCFAWDRQNGGERQWPRGRRRHQGGVQADLLQAQGGAARRHRLRVHHGVAPVDRSRNYLPPTSRLPFFSLWMLPPCLTVLPELNACAPLTDQLPCAVLRYIRGWPGVGSWLSPYAPCGTGEFN
jgi:hypothetical protein